MSTSVKIPAWHKVLFCVFVFISYVAVIFDPWVSLVAMTGTAGWMIVLVMIWQKSDRERRHRGE